MSEVIGFVGMSHAPFATMSPPSSADAPGGRFLADTRRVAAAVAALAPDAIVVIGPDHFHGSFYDLMPPFAIGVEAAEGFGDFGSLAGPVPVAGDLAWAVRDGLAGAGFDVALSYALTVDHGIVQGWHMVTGDRPVPMVPLVVNTAAPPLPSLARCDALGAALGDAIRSWDSPARVLVLASGGLSHWLPSNDPRTLPDERRTPLIHGRKDTRAFAAAREPRVRAMGGNPDARVNAEWDRWFLKQLEAAEVGPILALGENGLEEAAGSGGNEVRGWLVGMAAVRRPLAWTSYEPVREWITGMGIGTTFEVAP
jgi:2,3-dihydroxyphenylpropionate 1,2-dioxygenase